MTEAAPRSSPGGVRTFLSTHRRGAVASAVLVIAAIAFGLVWFQPQRLFIDKRLDEALPEVAGEADRQTDQGGSATSPGTQVAPDEKVGPRILRKGSFRSLEHATSGKASIVRLEDGRKFLRFENLATSNGPDLRVYLSEVPASDDWYAYGERFIDLGPLKGNLGSQNYLLPGGTDLSRYESAVVWCRRFTVGFGVAPLDN